MTKPWWHSSGIPSDWRHTSQRCRCGYCLPHPGISRGLCGQMGHPPPLLHFSCLGTPLGRGQRNHIPWLEFPAATEAEGSSQQLIAAASETVAASPHDTLIPHDRGGSQSRPQSQHCSYSLLKSVPCCPQNRCHSLPTCEWEPLIALAALPPEGARSRWRLGSVPGSCLGP